VLITYLSWNYLIAMAIWLVALAAAFYGLLYYRRACRRKSRRLVLANAGLAAAMLLAAGTAVELVFACCVDFSDTFSISNISQRWMARHLDDESNYDGFRDRNELNKTVSAGLKRIVFLGDSFTAGHGVPRMEDRFTDRVAARLEEKEPGNYVVANVAKAGYNVTEVVHLMQLLLQGHYDVSVAVYVYNLNDIDQLDPQTREALGEISRTRPSFFLFRDTYFFNWLYFRLMELNRPGVRSYFEMLNQAYRSRPWLEARALLAQIRQECASQGIDFRIAVFPFLQNMGPNYPFRDAHAKIVEFCKSEKIPVLDLEPVFREHAGENLVVSRFDAHPNERAHAIAAEAIEKGLLSDLVAATHP
jgi:lysophospholipase L1-like esterase